MIFFGIFLSVFISSIVADISLDYYFGNADNLRSEKPLCRSREVRQYCEQRCGVDHVCLLGKCFCIKQTYFFEDASILPSAAVGGEDGEASKYDSRLNYGNAYHPALRHHIAHFCPNLDEARKCIQKCLPLGKPAFCGKDHVCYCGHMYSHSNDKKVDKNAYANFADMYKKYFGKNEDADDDDVVV